MKISRRELLKTTAQLGAAATIQTLTGCNNEPEKTLYIPQTKEQLNQNRSHKPYKPPIENTLEGRLLMATQHLIEEIDENAPSLISQQLNLALQELYDTISGSISDLPEKFAKHIQNSSNTQIISKAEENALFLPDPTLMIQNTWVRHPINLALKLSQTLRHRELITTNQFQIPQELQTPYLYATAMESINQLYGNGMLKAFTNQLKPQTVTKYRHGILRSTTYQTTEIPYAKPGSPWMYLKQHTKFAKPYFESQLDPNSIEIAETGIYVTQQFIDYTNAQDPTLTHATISPVLPHGF